MEGDKESSETIPLSVINENANETSEKSSTQVVADEEKLAIDIADLPPDTSNSKTSGTKVSSTDVPDGFNEYRNKKTLTQGMMDVALFSANINQLRSILDQMAYSNSNAYAVILICMLLVSILLQVGVGLLLLLSTRYNVNSAEERKIVYRYGNYVVAGIFLVTVVNVFISAFGTPGDRYIPDERYPNYGHSITSSPTPSKIN